jgi:hypothetical protein
MNRVWRWLLYASSGMSVILAISGRGRRSKEVTPALEMQREEGNTSEARLHARGKGRALLLLTGAVLLAFSAVLIWPGLLPTSNAPTPKGGITIMHDRVPLEEPHATRGLSARASVDVWEAGVPNVSMVSMLLTFDSPLPHDHWYVVASGDYAVQADLPVSMYCKYGDAKPAGDRLWCAPQLDNPRTSYRFGQELATDSGGELAAFSVQSLAGYDRENVTVISGIMPKANAMGDYEVELILPIRAQASLRVNGDQYLAVPPIGLRPTTYSQGARLKQPCATREDTFFVLTETCAPVAPVLISETKVDLGVLIGSRTIEYASPDTVSDDELVWRVDEGFPGGKALVSDPFAQQDETRRAFVAALFLSLSLSLVLLLVEQLLFHRQPAN